MSYIGNQPTQAAFVTDQFNGDGTTVAFTMSVAPANTASVLIAVSGVLQDPSTYSVSGTTLTFSAAPPAGTGNISVRYLGIPASNIVSTAYRTITEVTATAGQTVFTPASYVVGFLDVFLNGVCLGSADYTATNGTTVTLAVGATAGDLVRFESFSVSSVLNAIPAQAGAVVSSYLASGAASQAFLDAATGTGTGALKLPVGTTAQRPTGAAGLIRQNSTTGNPEWWDATTSSWLQFSQPAGYLVNYLVVAGGGGGGQGTNAASNGGGGGAGGYLTSSVSLSAGTAYTITVGAGGANSSAGASSSISSIATSLGGGRGGSSSLVGVGGSGSSGGGGDGLSPYQAGGTGTSGQGNNGGSGTGAYGGGGGGAGAVGANATGAGGGNGGVGLYSSITGASTPYAGGGGGSSNAPVGTGGAGGGGAGGLNAAGVAGTANTGGGGGGGSGNGASYAGGAGGSGIVIISYLGAQRGTGGTVTSSGGYTIHTFTSSGTYNA